MLDVLVYRCIGLYVCMCACVDKQILIYIYTHIHRYFSFVYVFICGSRIAPHWQSISANAATTYRLLVHRSVCLSLALSLLAMRCQSISWKCKLFFVFVYLRFCFLTEKGYSRQQLATFVFIVFYFLFFFAELFLCALGGDKYVLVEVAKVLLYFFLSNLFLFFIFSRSGLRVHRL